MKSKEKVSEKWPKSGRKVAEKWTLNTTNHYDVMCLADTIEDDGKSGMIPLLSPFVVGGFQSTTFALLFIYF